MLTMCQFHVSVISLLGKSGQQKCSDVIFHRYSKAHLCKDPKRVSAEDAHSAAGVA